MDGTFRCGRHRVSLSLRRILRFTLDGVEHDDSAGCSPGILSCNIHECFRYFRMERLVEKSPVRFFLLRRTEHRLAVAGFGNVHRGRRNSSDRGVVLSVRHKNLEIFTSGNAN